MKKKPVMTKANIERVGSVTLVGVDTRKFPVSRGNCFSAKIKDEEKGVKILNMNYENLNYLLKSQIISWPIQIQIFDQSHYAIIDDDRVPKNYYQERYCSVCTPERLQSKEWRDDLAKRIRSGEVKRSIIRWSDGRKGYIDKVEFKARPTPLRGKFTLVGDDDAIIK